MITRNLGKSGISVSAVGLGCMGLSEFYGPPVQESDAITLLHRAIDMGVTHFDTAEIYGQGRNEQLLGTAFAGRWDRIVLATKFGPQRDPATGALVGVDGSPANVRSSCEKSLQRLGAEKIDLYYLHRVDTATPIEETVGEMAKLVQEGKIRAIGLSEASATTIERANSVHPVAALQTEYSIFSRDIERDILPTCVALGISLVAYCPLGRGMLTGRLQLGERAAYRRDGFPGPDAASISARAISSPTSSWWRPSRESPPEGDALRPRSLWPGYWAGGIMSSPFPAPPGSPISRPTWGRRTTRLAKKTSGCSTNWQGRCSGTDTLLKEWRQSTNNTAEFRRKDARNLQALCSSTRNWTARGLAACEARSASERTVTGCPLECTLMRTHKETLL